MKILFHQPPVLPLTLTCLVYNPCLSVVVYQYSNSSKTGLLAGVIKNKKNKTLKQKQRQNSKHQ